jgi:hypothetical protein
MQAQREGKSKGACGVYEKNAPVHQAYNEGARNGKIMDCCSASFRSPTKAGESAWTRSWVAMMQADPLFMPRRSSS